MIPPLTSGWLTWLLHTSWIQGLVPSPFQTHCWSLCLLWPDLLSLATACLLRIFNPLTDGMDALLKVQGDPFLVLTLGRALHWLHLCEMEPLKSMNSCRYKGLHISTLWQASCSVCCTEVLKCLGEEPQRGRGIFKMFNLSQGKCQENPYFSCKRKRNGSPINTTEVYGLFYCSINGWR